MKFDKCSAAAGILLTEGTGTVCSVRNMARIELMVVGCSSSSSDGSVE